MKTILARFQSLTKDPDSLSPEVQEALGGETVDANVTEAALAKAGVALRDETGQFRAAKDVLLELNAVWNDLDKNTQRYIATQTAGARQQSRFIAMMQNNARTQELLGYAYDSEGASQKQFEKTLDSLEAKVNKFKNAWNEFTMGVANNTVIKATVDVLTDFLSIINKITGSIDGPFGSAISMITKSLLAIGGFKLGGSVVNQIIKILSGNFDREAIDISKIGIKGALQLGGYVFSQFSAGFKKASNKFDWIKAIFSKGKLNGLKELGSRGKSGIKSLLDSAYQNVEFGKLRGAGLGDKAAGSLMQNIDAFKKYQDLLKSGKTAEEAYAATVLMTNANMGKKTATVWASKVAITEESAAYIGARLGLEGQTLATFKATAQEKGFAAALREVALAEGEAAAGGYAMLGPLLIIGAVLTAAGIAWAVYSKSIEDACNRAEESIKSFNETKDSVTENLEKINEVSGEFEKLSKGVSNGENIGLSTAEFEKYHEIVNELVKINPSIVEGYDAQGNAIINTTSALRTLREEEERRLENAKIDYTSDSNLEDIITNVNEKNKEIIKNRKLVVEDTTNNGQGYNITRYMTAEEVLEKDKTYAQDRIELLKQIRETEEAGADTEGLEKQLDTLDSMHSAANEVKQDYSEIADVLNTYVSSLDNGASLQANFGNILSAGIQDIAASGKSAGEMKNDVRQLIDTLNDSPDVLKTYKDAIRKVNDAKEEFDNSIKDTNAIETYNKAVNDAYESMIDQAENFEGATRDAMINAAESMKSYASEATVSLVEALNPLLANVEAARGLGEVLDEVKDKDYYSTSDSVHEVTQEALSEKNLAGPNGSRSFQKAASAYINEDYLAKHDYSKKASESMLRQIDKMTQEGRAGAEAFQAFYQEQLKDTKWLNDKGGLSFNSNEIGEVAKAMGLNESLFAALVEKYSQYTGASWVDNPKQVTEGALQDGTAFKGKGKDAKATIWQDDLAEAASEAGIAYSTAKKNFEEGGGQVLSAAQMTGKELGNAFKKIGTEFTNADDKLNTDAIVASMVASGKTEEEINSVLNKMTKDGVELDSNSKEWSEIIDNAQIAEAIASDPTANVIQSDVVSRLDAMLTIMGGSDLSDANANQKKSDEIVNEINNATDKNKDASEIADKRINELYSENQLIEAALAKGNLDEGTKEEYQARLDSNEQQIKNIEEAKENNASGIEAYNNAIEAITNKNNSDFLKAFSQLTKAQQTSFIENNKKAINEYFKDKGYDNTKTLDASQKASVLNTENKYGADIAQKQVNVYASVEDEDLDGFYDTLESLPEDVQVTLYTENPGYKVLKDYETEINKLQEDDKKVVLKTVTEGDFNTEEWMKFAKENPKLAVGIQFETEKLKGVENVKIPGELDISDKKIKEALKGAQVHVDTYYKLTKQEPPKKKKVDVDYTLGKQEKPEPKTATVSYSTNQKTVITVKASAKGQNLASVFLGQNILGSAANGAKRGRIGPKGKGGLTLTGEVGPELVWEPSKGYSYITGADGPEMRNLSGDAVVWPADQTKKIMRTAANGQNLFGSAYDSPTLDNVYKPSTTKTTNSKSNKTTKTKNKNKNKGKKKKNNKKRQKYIKRLFDRWYNAALRFEKFQKKVELAEKKLENWRQYNFKTFEKVGQQFKDTITNLNNQILQAKAAQTAAKQQRTAAKKAKLRDSKGKVIKKKKISRYVKFDKDGMAYLTTKGLKLKDNKLGNAVKEYIENYNAAWEEEKKWEAQIIDLQKEMIDQLNKERDNYISLLERTRDALVQKIQKQIDKESKIIEAINDANSKLIDSMNKNLSKMRQDRDNKKTEEELQDKYAQLNAMKRIGSGANASDIKKLEKEIKDLEQNYTDSLVDQKISDFQEKNDSASQRKQTAIEIAQALLETRSENGYFNEEAIQMIKDAMADGIYNSDDALWKLLNEAENQNKTAVEIAKHTEEITSLLQGMFNYFNGTVKKGMQTQGYEGQKYAKFVDSKGNETNIIAGKEFTGDGTITNDNKKYTGVTFDTDGKYHYTGVEEVKTTSASKTSKPKSHAHGYLKKVDNKSYKRLSKSDKGYLVKGLNDLIADKKINAKKKDSLSTKVKAAEKKAGVKKPNGTWDAAGAKKIKKKFPKYATGGIADFTGPAWLDGTPSKPELILNAQDSKNFILLKDALSSISSGTVAPSGDNYYDISINVDKLSSDYDVDQVANKIKRMIVNDSKYRGVSSVRRSK